ncbi:hypothetical protein EJ995_07355 [Nonlabens ponticola]|uniref:Uncharacterized protein n=2 Tax=Nonlabens ponticola TaxID=2496866 RepID=A0A3S9N1A5_9FLAO|nr:hypothetical protein EJ995_07355 [Nonlabens ponticola]
MLGRTNIEEKLQKARNKSVTEGDLLKQVANILQEEGRKQDDIIARMKSPQKPTPRNNFDLDLMETDRIYHVDQIREICVNYRLRFLDTKYFKNEIPLEAINKVKQLEKDHDITLKGFKIVAPSKMFKLENADDPLLFAPIGNGYFYLIHKWGNDLNAFRKAWAWPFKSLENLIVVTILISLLAAWAVPNGLFSKDTTGVQFVLIFFFTFKSIASMILYYAFAAGKNFNTSIWNSKYFNA